MSVESYPKIRNLGHRDIVELFLGEVVIQEKVDGSQFGFKRTHSDGISCRSKGQQLNLDNPNKMFKEAIETVKALAHRLQYDWIYRGEYLQRPKHNKICYDRIPRNHIALFDVFNDGKYLGPLELQSEAIKIEVDCVPVLYQGIIRSEQEVRDLLDRESFLGGSKIEGVVIKNYANGLIGKLVNDEFKEVHKIKTNKPINFPIAELGKALGTEARWEKAIQHLEEKGELTNTPKDIGPLLKEIHLDVLSEEKDMILEFLFRTYWKSISKEMTKDFPLWYKQRIMSEQKYSD